MLDTIFMILFKPHTHPEVVNASVLFYRKGNESREDRKQTQIYTSSIQVVLSVHMLTQIFWHPEPVF